MVSILFLRMKNKNKILKVGRMRSWDFKLTISSTSIITRNPCYQLTVLTNWQGFLWLWPFMSFWLHFSFLSVVVSFCCFSWESLFSFCSLALIRFSILSAHFLQKTKNKINVHCLINWIAFFLAERFKANLFHL